MILRQKTATCVTISILKSFDGKRGDEGGMPGNEKELNCYLLDQITLIERLEMVAEDGGIEAVKRQLAIEKRFIERKLYQKPPLENK